MKRLFTWMFCAALLVAIAGCGGGGSGSSNGPDPTVRYINGVCDALALDFWMDDNEEIAGVGFTGSSPTFDNTDARTRDISVRESGTTKDLWTEQFEFARDTDSIVCALGLVNFGTEFLKRVQLGRFLIDRRIPNANKSRIYVIHGFNRAVGLETPEIDFQNPGNNPQIRLAGIEYLTEQHIDIDSTVQTFEARRGGTESVFVSTTFTFQSGKVYAVLVLGIEGGVGVLAPRIEIIELQTE